MDWSEWHRAYDEPGSNLSQRLRIVQARIREVLDAAPPGPITAVSICAGQGRDLLEVLAVHPRRWVSGPPGGNGVGMHRFIGQPRPLATGERMFAFVGHKAL